MKKESTNEINHLLSLMERMECHNMTADEVEERLTPTEEQEEPEQSLQLQETKQCRKITITESQLKRLLARPINEAGEISFKDAEGNAHTNSTEMWRGVPGTKVFQGEEGLKEVNYNGIDSDLNELEDLLYFWFEEGMRDRNERERFMSETGNSGAEDDENFEAWVNWKGQDLLLDVLNAANADFEEDDYC